jgi:hypothetical protein
MSRNLFSMMIMGLVFLTWPAALWAQCPEAPHDPGICDTLYVEVHPPDTLFSGFARALIFVTHDVPDPYFDSLAMFQIPLCFTRTNPARFCSVSWHWNNIFTYPFPAHMLERSIFRHVIEDGDTVIHNWMMDQAELMTGVLWDDVILDMDGTSHFWLHAAPCNLPDQSFGEGSRVLLATMTFRMEDTMTICIDSCFWPPSHRLVFVGKWALEDYVPRHNLPHCFSISYPQLGDPNADGVIDIGDVVCLINYLYRGSPSPVPIPVGDVNCDGVVDVGDVVRMIGYLYKGEPPPSC